MNEIKCTKCKEPWSVYGLRHEDFLPDDAYERVSSGEGCPACDWGENERASDGHDMQAVQHNVMNTEKDPIEVLHQYL